MAEDEGGLRGTEGYFRGFLLRRRGGWTEVKERHETHEVALFETQVGQLEAGESMGKLFPAIEERGGGAGQGGFV